MKKILATLFFLVATMAMMAQAPQKFTYQGVIRDAAGNLVRNAPVSVRVSLLKNSTEGVAVYCEMHRQSTNANGLLTLTVGDGSVVGGDMTAVDWADGPYFLKTETDITGGSNYTLIGAQQLLSVPYALYAGNVADLTVQLDVIQQQLDSLKEQIGEGGSGSGTGENARLAKAITSEVTDITTMSASCDYTIVDMGTYVTARGVCWSTQPNPTVADNHTSDGICAGTFTGQLTNLQEVTTYYVRAYATNSDGTAYGDDKSFTTLGGRPCTVAPTVTDYDNNVYNTVQIGEQCWMRENMRAEHYADGTKIDQGTSTSFTTAYWYYPNNNSSNKATYGLLYNWKAVMRNASSSSANPSGVQGICPNGWHVPSDAEWTQLTDYVSSQSQYRCNSNSSNIVKALASTTGWKTVNGTCVVGDGQESNNATGFSALPAGRYYSYYDFGDSAFFQSATENGSYDSDAYVYALVYNDVNVSRGSHYKNYSFSVRCLRD